MANYPPHTSVFRYISPLTHHPQLGKLVPGDVVIPHEEAGAGAGRHADFRGASALHRRDQRLAGPTLMGGGKCMGVVAG